MSSRHALLLIASVALFALPSVDASDHSGVVRTRGGHTPTSLAAPLTPSLQCSACEVTCREVHAAYAKKSLTSKFHGTEVEAAYLLDGACSAIPQRYVLAQENFGARLKVFADPASAFDRQVVEPAQFYHDADEARFSNAVHRLRRFCEAFIERFYETHFENHVRDRTAEDALRRDMCLENATRLCAAETLAPYAAIERRKRRRWKHASGARAGEIRRRLIDELNGGASDHADAGDEAVAASMHEL